VLPLLTSPGFYSMLYLCQHGRHRAQHRKTKLPLVPRAGKGAPQDPSKQSITLLMGTATFERLGSSDKERAKTVNAALKAFFAQRPAEATAE
jgi:hypothetical protein